MGPLIVSVRAGGRVLSWLTQPYEDQGEGTQQVTVGRLNALKSPQGARLFPVFSY